MGNCFSFIVDIGLCRDATASPVVVNTDGVEGKIFCLFAIVNCQDWQFTVAKRHKKKIYHFVRFHNKEEVKRKLIKKMNSVWLMVKIRSLMHVKIDKIVF